MIDWLIAHGSMMVLLLFFAIFLGFAFWAYAPRNRMRMDDYGHIPLKEKSNDE